MKYIIALVFIYINGYQIFAQQITFQKLYFYDEFNPSRNKNFGLNYYATESFSDGGFATIGFLTDTFNLASATSGVLNRFDCLGNIIWSKNLGVTGTGTNTNFGIVEADNGDLVYCFNQSPTWFKSTMQVGRIDPSGNYKWIKRLGTDSEYGRDMIATKDGGFVIAGSTGFYGTDRSADDIYLVKIDANGNILWNKTYGNPNGTYDEAFTLEQSNNGNIFISGRCINRGTFMCFVMKTDPNGEPIKTIAIGQENHSTNGYAIDITSDDKVIVTGYTSILEANFQERGDLFLFKMDTNLNIEYTKVYDPIVGGDLGALGEGIVEMRDGSYAVVAESGSFTTHNLPGPQGVGKWLGVKFNKDGSINKAYIYNHFGSQYPRIARAKNDGYYIAGFSTEWALSRAFQGLVIKTNEDLIVPGCADTEVTSELETYDPTFIIEDFKYQRKSGGAAVNGTATRKDSSLLQEIICLDHPTIAANFSGPDTLCIGQIGIFKDKSTVINGVSYMWESEGKTQMDNKDFSQSFTGAGIHEVNLIVSLGCISNKFTKKIFIKSFDIINTNVDICDINLFSYKNKKYNAFGVYTDTTNNAACGLVEILTIKQKEYTIEFDTLICNQAIGLYGKTFDSAGIYRIALDNNSRCIELHIKNGEDCVDCVDVPNVFTPANQDNVNDVFIPLKPCKAAFTNYQFNIYNRWGQMMFETQNPELGWDGRYKGELQDPQTFIYVLTYDLKFSELNSIKGIKRKGDVTLIR